MGSFDRWPTGHGFDYFYGILAGETSQYEPRLYENLDPIEPPHEEGYHLTEDMVDKARAWLKRHQAFSPDKPFLMYWAPGAVHGPHHVFSEWADKYQGKFDDGWDAYRERVFKCQKQLGWIAKPGAPATVILKVDGKELARTIVERTVPLAFTASETFDVGVDLGAPVSLDYAERRPFEFDGTIKQVTVVLK